MGINPLIGLTVINTRDVCRAREFSSLLEENGADVFEFPSTAIIAIDFSLILTKALAESQSIDWLVFTSSRSVVDYHAWLKRAGTEQLTSPGRLACVGARTAKTAMDLGLGVNLVSKETNAVGLARAMVDLAKKNPEEAGRKRAMLLRARKGTPELREVLITGGWQVEDIALYDTVASVPTDAQIESLEQLLVMTMAGSNEAGNLREGSRICLSFLSGEAVRNFLSIVNKVISGVLTAKVLQIPAFVIGPKTEAIAKESGFANIVSAREQSLEGVVAAIAMSRWVNADYTHRE